MSFVYRDCFGQCYGTNVIDDCGYCTGSETKLIFNQQLDCTGVCDGPFKSDSCEICQLPGEDGVVTEYADCNGDCFGTASMDSCGVCYGGNTGQLANTTIDQCGVCNGNGTTCYGCDGAVNSGIKIDNCGVCGGNDCGCQHIVMVSPNRGPSKGGTSITITGSGFFRNGSYYDSLVPNCGAPQTDSESKSIPVTCSFVIDDETAIGSAYIANQSTIICITPSVANPNTEFSLSVSVDNGPLTDPIIFYFESYADVSIESYTPTKGHLNTKTTITFSGTNLINTSDVACLVSNMESCGNNEVIDSNGYHIIPAQYIDTSTVSCTLPASSSPCQVTVQLSLDGQASGIIEYVDFDGFFTYAYSAPVVNSIHFVDNITSLVIEFDQAIEIRDGLELTCNNIFSNSSLDLLSTEALCFWQNSAFNALLITLPVTASVEIDLPISFKDNTINTKDKLYSFSHSDKIRVSSAINNIHPVAIIEGPSSIPFCGQARYSAINSLYPGYKRFIYKWSVYTYNSSIPGLINIVNTFNALPLTTAEIEIPISLFQISTTYVIQATITNALGLSDTSSITVIKDTSKSLQIAISSAEDILLKHEQDLLLQSRVINEGCTNFNEFDFNWSLYKLVDVRRMTFNLQDLTEVHTNNPILHIPASYFEPEDSYRVQLNFQTTNGVYTASKSININVEENICIARIHGGDRTLSPTQMLVLDASTSTVLSEYFPNFVWQCSVVGSGIPCYNATFKESTRTIKLPQQQLVTIPVSNLQADYRYKFTVLLTQGLCKSSATVIIEIVPPTDPIATIQILTPSHVITSSQKVVIEGLVYTTNPVTVSWSCLSLPDQEYIDLQNGDVTSSPTKYKAVVQSDIESQTNIVIIGKASRANLVIKPNILTVSRPYTFQLLAEYEDQFVSTQVTIIPNGPPVIHTFSVTPTSGIALSTKFKLLVDRVTDDIDDYPLHYQYGLVRSDTIYWLSGLMTEKYIDVLLPHRSNLKVVVRIYDSFGEYSDSFANVDVSENPSVDYDSFIQGLANDLQSRHEWTAVLSSLVSALDSFEDNDISIISVVIDLYIDIFNNYTPFTLEHLFLHLTTVELISSKMPEIGSNDKLLLLNSVIKILDMMISDVEGNFKLPDFDSFSESDGILRSDRYNISNFHEPLDSRSLQALMNIKSNLLSSNWNSNIASKSREITQKLNEILCRQTVLGEDRILLNSKVQDFLFMKAIPFGSFNITNKGTIDLATTIEELYNQQACSGTNTNTACSEMCFQISSYTKDYFSNSDQIITLSSSTQEVIISTIEGSDPLNVQLYSNIVTVDLSLPTRNGVIEVENLDSSIRVYIPVSSALPDDSSIPLCLYRDTKTLSNDQWQFDTLQTPDQAVLNGIKYYLCEYNHLSEFVIGLLPPPIIIIPTSSTFSAISSPSPSPTTSESTSETSSPSPIVPVQSQVGNNIGPIIGGVVVVLLFVIVMVVVFILVAFVVWRKKQSGKLKIAPASSESSAPSEKQVALEERSKTPDEAKKVHLGVIQLLKNGDRLVLGSVNVAMSTRLRELRNQLTDNFDSLKKKPFYLCTKELSDIEPATEQQQFVSIVYSNIVYIRDVTADNKDFKRQFCTCSKVAQFECSSCNERGYCSKECQQKHWDTGHQKECRRFSERRNRSDILLRRQTSSGTLLTEGQSVTETVDITKSPRQSLESPTNWKGFLNQSRAYQQLPSISPRPQNLSTASNLPPLTRQPLIQPIDETLRETLDSDIVTSEPKSQTSPVQPKLSTRPPLPRLASTGHVSIGQLASQTPTQSGQLPISPRTLVTPISPPPVAPMSSYFTSTPLYGSYESRELQQLQLQQLQQSYAQQQLAQSYAPVAPMTSYYNSTPSNDRYDSRELQQLQQSYTQQQLAQSYAQRRVGQVSLKYSPQTPFFSRPSVTSLETQTPQLRRDISISSIQSDILNMSKTGTGLRRDIRNEPLLELEHESSSTTSGSEEDDKKGEEDQVSTQTSRPPSLAIRRRHSSRMSFKENSTTDQKYDSTDSDDSSDEDSDDEQ